MKNNTEITLPVSELKAVLPGLTKVIARRATLPILGCIRVERNEQGIVSLQATDLDDCLTARIKEPVPGPATAFLMPFEPLAKTVKGLSGKDTLVLFNNGKKEVKLRTFVGGSHIDQKLESLDLTEWPPIPVCKETGIVLDAELKQAIREAFEFSSQDSSRYILQSAYLDVADKNAHYVVGTNGRVLFSANSFNRDLMKSLIIPAKKFLEWSGAWDEEVCSIAHELGKEHPKTKVRDSGYFQFRTDRWTFITKQIEGEYPNWKQAVPTVNRTGTTLIDLGANTIKQILEVIPMLPGDLSPNHAVRLRVAGERLVLEGQHQHEKEWTSIPIQDARITGKAVTVGLNRHYLASALRLGLGQLEVVDPFSALVFSNNRKRLVVMPVNLDGARPSTAASPATPEPQQPATAPTSPETTTNHERTEMSKTTAANTPPTETQATETAIKSVIQQVEKIKDALKDVIGEFNEVLASLKQAEKEKKVSEKEIETIRATLRTIQSVKI